MPNDVHTESKKKSPAGAKMPKADFITSIGLMAFSAFVLIESLKMPRLEHRNINPYSIPGIVPALLGIVMGILSFILFIRSLRFNGYLLRDHQNTSSEAKVAPPFWQKLETLRVLLTLGFCLLYAVILVGWVWFPVATFLYVFAFISVFEFERGTPAKQQIRMFVVAAIMALLTAVLVSVVFRYLFLIRLP